MWEFTYPSPTDDLDFSQGAGPHSTPLIAGNLLYATSTRKELFALNKATGQARLVARLHEGIRRAGARPRLRVQSAALQRHDHRDVGGPGQAVAAFNQQTGALVWKAGDFQTVAGVADLIDVDGQKQLVLFAGEAVAGLDPANGRTLWTSRTRPTGA